MAYDTIDLLAGSPVLFVGEGNTFTEQELPYSLNIFGYTRRSCQYGVDLSAYAGKVIRGWHFKASFTVGGTESGRTCGIGLASGEWAGKSKIMQREPSARVYPTPNGLVELEDVFLPTRYPVAEILPNGAPGSRDWRGVVLRIITGTGGSLTTTLSETTFEVAEIYVSDPPVLGVVGALPAVLPTGEDTIVTFSLRYPDDDPVVGARIDVYGVGSDVTTEQLTWGEDDGLYQVRVRPNVPGYFTLYYMAAFPSTLHDEFFYFQPVTGYSITAPVQWDFASESNSEEPSSCFWTDLVNVTQVCGETPPEPEYPMEVTLRCYRGPPTPAGYAHSTGLNPTDSVNAPRSYAALAGAISVELLAVSDGPNDAEGNDLPYDPSSYSELSAPIPLDDGYFDGATVLDPPGVFVVNEYGYWTFGSDDPSIGDWRVGVVRVTTADSVVTYSVLLDWGGFG